MGVVPLRSFMSRDVLSIAPDTGLKEVAQLMREHNYSCLPVVRDDKPVGIITERDMVHLIPTLLSRKAALWPVAAEIMSVNPIMLYQDQSIFDALVMCKANHIRHLPVINDDDYLCGMVTFTDITNLHRSLLESHHNQIERSIVERNKELEEANRRLQELSLEDPLLGIGNRRAMEVDLKCTHNLSKRYHDNYAIAMLDVDNFKLYNDYYGHQAGDEALQRVASCVRAIIRSSDRLYRYGGEELLVLLPQTSSSGAAEIAGRILAGVEAEKIPHCKSMRQVITASCGVSVYQSQLIQPEKDWSHLIKWADLALYAAKRGGRNQLVVNGEQESRKNTG